MSADVQAVFDALVRENGGVDVLGVAGCARVRAAAVILADPDLDARGAATAAALLAQMPAPPRPSPAAPSTSRYDLAALTDRELDGFFYLGSKADRRSEGWRPARPDRRLRGSRCKTPREFALRQFARSWTRSSGPAASRARPRRLSSAGSSRRNCRRAARRRC